MGNEAGEGLIKIWKKEDWEKGWKDLCEANYVLKIGQSLCWSWFGKKKKSQYQKKTKACKKKKQI